MTQSELARRLGITRSSVNGWEMGLVLPSTATLVELSRTFHVSTDYILGLENDISIQTAGLTQKEIDALLVVIDCFLEHALPADDDRPSPRDSAKKEQ